MNKRDLFINVLLIALAFTVAAAIPLIDLGIEVRRNPLSEASVWGRGFLAHSILVSMAVTGPILTAVFIGIRLLIRKEELRPRVITALCIILLVVNGLDLFRCVGAIIIIGMMIQTILDLIPTALAIASLVGLWKMRKWGPVIYVASLAVGTLVYCVYSQVNIWHMIISPYFWVMKIAFPLTYTVAVLRHWSKMK